MPYVYSTATCGTDYVKYDQSSVGSDRGSSGHNRIIKRVSINGGHGLANKNLFTPMGVVTFVSDGDMEFLLQNESFQRHIKSGFITYDKKKVEPSKKASSMATKDGSAPLTPNDFEKGDHDDSDLRIYKGIVKNKAF